MVKEIKVALIGAGSLTFTPSLLKGLALSPLSGDCELTVALMDIDKRILDIMYKVGTKLVEHLKSKKNAWGFKVESYCERKPALEAADFVVVTVGVGGVKATHLDVEIPKSKGILQAIGDTVGPGGIVRAFRHTPLLLELARDVEDVCPSAHVFNYSNPLTPLVRVVGRESKVKCYGLCTGPYAVKPALAACFQVACEDIQLYMGGINHLLWIKDFSVGGERGYPLLENGAESGETRGNLIDPVISELYRVFGILPAIGLGRHVAEFFPNIFMQPGAVEKYKIALFPEGTIYDYRNREPLESVLANIASGTMPIDALLNRRGLEEEGIGVVRLMEALALDKRVFCPGINVLNEGIISNLPSWGVVEVSAYVDSTGVHPFSIGSLPKGVAAVLSSRLEQYELTVDAALLCDKSLAMQSLLLDGYVRSIDLAKGLLDEMLNAEKEWLPSGWFEGGGV
jgi:alpha-galactosidase